MRLNSRDLLQFALLSYLFLACCATPAPAPPVAVVSCLPLTSYTPDQQRALAKALDGLPADSPIIMAITDYGALRAADRACMASAK